MHAHRSAGEVAAQLGAHAFERVLEQRRERREIHYRIDRCREQRELGVRGAGVAHLERAFSQVLGDQGRSSSGRRATSCELADGLLRFFSNDPLQERFADAASKRSAAEAADGGRADVGEVLADLLETPGCVLAKALRILERLNRRGVKSRLNQRFADRALTVLGQDVDAELLAQVLGRRGESQLELSSAAIDGAGPSTLGFVGTSGRAAETHRRSPGYLAVELQLAVERGLSAGISAAHERFRHRAALLWRRVICHRYGEARVDHPLVKRLAVDTTFDNLAAVFVRLAGVFERHALRVLHQPVLRSKRAGLETLARVLQLRSIEPGDTSRPFRGHHRIAVDDARVELRANARQRVFSQPTSLHSY